MASASSSRCRRPLHLPTHSQATSPQCPSPFALSVASLSHLVRDSVGTVTLQVTDCGLLDPRCPATPDSLPNTPGSSFWKLLVPWFLPWSPLQGSPSPHRECSRRTAPQRQPQPVQQESQACGETQPAAGPCAGAEGLGQACELRAEVRKPNGLFHVRRPPYLGCPCHPLLLITRALPRLEPRPLPQPGGQLCPHCPLSGLPPAGGKGRGLPIVLEQQPNVAGAPMIDGAWKLVPEFN